MWYNHPDTLAMASARNAADKTGHKQGTLDWLIAYREAYSHEQEFPNGSLAPYLERLDAKIEEIRNTIKESQ